MDVTNTWKALDSGLWLCLAGLKGAALTVLSKSLEEEHLKVKLATC